MYFDNIIRAIKTITEYFILRSKYRRELFEGFDVKIINEELHLLSSTTEIIFVRRLGIKNCKLLFSKSKPNTIVIYEIKTLDIGNYDEIEFFSLEELQYNIFSNFMAPKLYFLTENEECQIKQYYGLKLPILLKVDKVSRYLGCKKGDIVCFSRKSGNLYARIVD
jgi:DNA-directed RNA polymerase subunit H (RpoH/RPB5)